MVWLPYRTQFDTRFEFTNFEAYTRSVEEFSVTLDKSTNQPNPTTQPETRFTAAFSEPTIDFTQEDVLFLLFV